MACAYPIVWEILEGKVLYLSSQRVVSGLEVGQREAFYRAVDRRHPIIPSILDSFDP